MKLKPKHIITTNFDTLTEDGDMVSADVNHLLLKIHGDVQNMDSLVLYEDDYLEYSEADYEVGS